MRTREKEREVNIWTLEELSGTRDGYGEHWMRGKE